MNYPESDPLDDLTAKLPLDWLEHPYPRALLEQAAEQTCESRQ
ncbi:hypothetical protein ACF09J_25150 [Streptomyces sp. NPDC014889]